MSRRRSPTFSRFQPFLQELDARIAPAGDVIANLDPVSGKLTIVGSNNLTSAGILAGKNDNALVIVGSAPRGISGHRQYRNSGQRGRVGLFLRGQVDSHRLA